MDPVWNDWQAILQLQETLYLCLIWLLAVSAGLMTFVCLLCLWLESFRVQRRPEPRSSSAANPAGSSPAVLRMPERAEEQSLRRARLQAGPFGAA